MMHRRHLLVVGLGAVALRPAQASPEAMAAAVAAFTGGKVPSEGRVTLNIAPLVDNGNTVPVSIAVQSPMTAADHVQRVALFTPANPQPDVAVFHLGPRNGRAEVATRMRLATSQTVIAVAALSDGTFWQGRAEVLVTLAACIES
jgi:sulfur-oxidizing protein SoxY